MKALISTSLTLSKDTKEELWAQLHHLVDPNTKEIFSFIFPGSNLDYRVIEIWATQQLSLQYHKSQDKITKAFKTFQTPSVSTKDRNRAKTKTFALNSDLDFIPSPNNTAELAPSTNMEGIIKTGTSPNDNHL